MYRTKADTGSGLLLKKVGEEGLRLVAVVTVRPEGEYHQDKKKCELYIRKELHINLIMTNKKEQQSFLEKMLSFLH